MDVRYDNILQAPLSPPGLPSLPSPITQRAYGWRLVDFEMAYKINHSVYRLSTQAECQLVMLWEEVEEPLDDDSSQYDTSTEEEERSE